MPFQLEGVLKYNLYLMTCLTLVAISIISFLLKIMMMIGVWLSLYRPLPIIPYWYLNGFHIDTSSGDVIIALVAHSNLLGPPL